MMDRPRSSDDDAPVTLDNELDLDNSEILVDDNE